MLGRSIGKYLMLFSTNVTVMVSATAKCSDPIRHHVAKWAPGGGKSIQVPFKEVCGRSQNL